MRPRFSIVVPYYNRPALIRECVASVIKQDFESWELILVDDASEKRLGDEVVLPSDRRIKVVRNDIRRGAGASRNRGARAATGHYIHFLDSDDRLAAGALSSLGALAQSDPDVMIGAWENVAADESCSYQFPSRPYLDDLANCAACGWVTGTVSVRASLCPSVSETRMPWEMAEVYLDAVAAARSVAYSPSLVAKIAQDSALSLTIAHDHFEPLRAGRFWAEMKERHATSAERNCAFDKRLFDAAVSVRRRGDRAGAAELFAKLDLAALPSYPWYERLKPVWFADKMGFTYGLGVHDLLSSLKRACRPHA